MAVMAFTTTGPHFVMLFLRSSTVAGHLSIGVKRNGHGTYRHTQGRVRGRGRGHGHEIGGGERVVTLSGKVEGRRGRRVMQVGGVHLREHRRDRRGRGSRSGGRGLSFFSGLDW